MERTLFIGVTLLMIAIVAGIVYLAIALRGNGGTKE
jgi:hypothetical protein